MFFYDGPRWTLDSLAFVLRSCGHPGEPEQRKHNVKIISFIEVKTTFERLAKDGKMVIHYSEIPKGTFILNYVSDRKGKKEINHFLTKSGRKPGVDFLMMS